MELVSWSAPVAARIAITAATWRVERYTSAISFPHLAGYVCGLRAHRKSSNSIGVVKVARIEVEAADVGSEPATALPSARRESAGSWWSSQFDKDIFALAVPAALALAADPLLGMVDTALVGRLGSDELVSLA